MAPKKFEDKLTSKNLRRLATTGANFYSHLKEQSADMYGAVGSIGKSQERPKYKNTDYGEIKQGYQGSKKDRLAATMTNFYSSTGFREKGKERTAYKSEEGRKQLAKLWS